MHMVNSYDPSGPVDLDPAVRRLLERREAVMGAPYRLFYEQPVHFVRAEGVTLYDEAGRAYLDAYNNVPVVGHGNPVVAEAVSAQMRTLNTHTRYLTDAVVDYAERLTALFPDALSQVVFACTGSEAVDLAARMARSVTGAQGFVVTRNAYHGTTEATAELSPSLGPNNPLPARVVPVDLPDLDDPDAAGTLASRVREAIAVLQERRVGLAGMIVDSVMSSDGLRPAPRGLLRGAVEAVHEAGGLYVADEVQPGFGRLGHGWWGFTRHEVVPDLVVLGKPMGNGVPISAVVGSPAVFGPFGRSVRYFNTFGGNPVSIAAASAVLDVIEELDLVRHARSLGEELACGMRHVAESDPRLTDVRGAGLFLAVDVSHPDGGPDPALAAAVVNGLRRRRVLISASGAAGNVLKVRPPLVIGAAEVQRIVDETAAVVRSLG